MGFTRARAVPFGLSRSRSRFLQGTSVQPAGTEFPGVRLAMMELTHEAIVEKVEVAVTAPVKVDAGLRTSALTGEVTVGQARSLDFFASAAAENLSKAKLFSAKPTFAEGFDWRIWEWYLEPGIWIIPLDGVRLTKKDQDGIAISLAILAQTPGVSMAVNVTWIEQQIAEV